MPSSLLYEQRATAADHWALWAPCKRFSYLDQTTPQPSASLPTSQSAGRGHCHSLLFLNMLFLCFHQPAADANDSGPRKRLPQRGPELPKHIIVVLWLSSKQTAPLNEADPWVQTLAAVLYLLRAKQQWEGCGHLAIVLPKKENNCYCGVDLH